MAEDSKITEYSSDDRNLPKLRKVLFWDTKMEWLDWDRQYKAIIRRVFERGDEFEKSEITRFYDAYKIIEALKDIRRF